GRRASAGRLYVGRSVGPVDAEWLEVGPDLLELARLRLGDELLRRAHLLESLAVGHAGDEIARELHREVFAREVGPEDLVGIAAAVAELAPERLRQVVAHGLGGLLAFARPGVREAAREIALLRHAGVDREIHLLGVGRHRIELDVGGDTGALDGD